VVNGISTDFALDGDSVVREGAAAGGAFTPSVTYLTGASGPIYRRDDTAGSVRWYVFDGLGCVVDEVDPSGNLTSIRGFDVYGAVRSNSGTATSRHGFCGQLGHTSENETELVYMRARYMDPVVGRFVSEDEDEDGTNWYCYAFSDPTNFVDRSGRGGNKVDLGGGWWVRIDNWYSESGTGNPVQDAHWGRFQKDYGSVRRDGKIKHGQSPTGKAKDYLKDRGWNLTGYDSVTAYAEQNPVDFICIMLDIDGDFALSAQVGAMGSAVGLS